MLEHLATWIITIISTLGYPGIVLTMAIESAMIPLPSEVIMPFSGFLVSTGRFTLFGVALSGAIGNVIGSLVAYTVGYYGHENLIRRTVRKWGKWILVSEDELDYTEKLLNKHKDLVVLVSRVIPGIRTVISLTCGFAKLPILRFIILTFVGSFVWSLFLAYIGLILGQNWESLGPIFHKFDTVLVVLILAAIGWYIYHKIGRKKHASQA